MLSGDVSKITWEQFKECFYAKLFSANVRYAKQQEFMNLEQGDMTVEQYDAKFDMLSRFAPEVVKDEAAKTKKFVRGLRLNLQGFVRALRKRVNPGQKRKAMLQLTVAPQRNLRLGGLFQRHHQELAATERTLRKLLACRSCGRSHGETAQDYFEQDSHFPVGKSFCHYSSGGRTSWYRNDKYAPNLGALRICMDWLSANHVSIDCSRKEVVFNPPSAASFKFKGAGIVVLPKVISAMKASKLLSQGTWRILASVMNTREPEVSMSFESVVREYPNVFPNELPGVGPPKEIDFAIELEPGISLISRAPYRMALGELKELKVQLQKLLDKGFIRPSVSP
ncbi:gag protease polyprotein [Cucumis melo var. makuwa]|uniref:Gag protease polyprotein n=1 Tax=Cucumis melo var. makuwa TaxID=1194695 RepID=A0A5A7TGJ3_CUCMM|nr:gag protease polyprotein [Cucumis melo var. makuwa]TYK17904.1 gag protease polyprotein [Cucumis melo var. makuwa]